MTVQSVETAVEQFFEANPLAWDVRDGTVRSRAGNRYVYLSSDLIQGMHKAIEYETGEAWKLVLKTCGKRWGQRLMASLDQELLNVRNQRLAQLTVEEWVALIQSWFADNGWGRMHIDLDLAMSDGIVVLTLEHSLFVSALPEVGDRVDALLEGVLSAMFSAVSGTEVDVIEGACKGRGDDTCTFIASGPERIESIEDQVDEGMPVSELIEALRVG